MIGIKIGEKHTYNDFRLRMLSLSISKPEPYTKKIEVPGMNGVYDVSESISGEVLYKNRILTAMFDMKEPNAEEFHRRFSELSNFMHGLVKKIVLDTDAEYYYEGRISVDYTRKNFLFYEITVSADIYPYKFKNENTVVTKSVLEQETIVCHNERMSVVPTITTDADFTLKFKDISVSVSAGENIIPDIKFVQGDNVITCYGTGNITFTYQEGSL